MSLTAPRRYRYVAQKLGGTVSADSLYRWTLEGHSTTVIAYWAGTKPQDYINLMAEPMPDPPQPINWARNNTDSAASMYPGNTPAFTAQARIAYPFPMGGYTWGTPQYPLPE